MVQVWVAIFVLKIWLQPRNTLLILPTLSVEYFDQLLGAACQVHVVYLAQLLGAVLFIHIISNHDIRLNRIKKAQAIVIFNSVSYVRSKNKSCRINSERISFYRLVDQKNKNVQSNCSIWKVCQKLVKSGPVYLLAPNKISWLLFHGVCKVIWSLQQES